MRKPKLTYVYFRYPKYPSDDSICLEVQLQCLMYLKKEKNLVVFCSMTNLSVGIWKYGHTPSFCLSVCLLLSTNFLNVLTLIDTI